MKEEEGEEKIEGREERGKKKENRERKGEKRREGEEGRRGGEERRVWEWEWNVSYIDTCMDITSMANILSIHSQRSPATQDTACPLSELTETAWRKVSVHQ